MDLTDHEFDELTRFIDKVSGIHIEKSKKYLIKQRLAPIVDEQYAGSYAALFRKLRLNTDEKLRHRVVDCLTTNETFFFRDIHPFDTFREVILPQLGEMIEQRKAQSHAVRKGAKVSLWCAAASTGQEPYSIAMLVHEYAMANAHRKITTDDFSILATDISQQALSVAIGAKYSDLEVSRGLSEERKQKYFTHRSGKWELRDTIEKMVHFRRFNLTEPLATLGGFDMIFCRNVLIYFNNDTKKKIFDQFHAMLPPGGLLLLGAAENPGLLTSHFEPNRAGRSIYFQNKE